MTTRSLPLYIAHFTTAGALDVYTVPTGFITIVKFLQVMNRTGAPADVKVIVKSPAAATTYWRYDPALADLALLGGETWFVLDEGWKIRIQTSAQPLDIIIAGAVLPHP